MSLARSKVTRRAFLAGSAAAVSFFGKRLPAEVEGVPIRAITKGPGFHWFAYYDKFQFDPTDRYALGMKVLFEHRSPTPQDSIEIGMIDLAEGDRWIPLGETTAWCWQQGCMLQWRPGSATEIVYNGRGDEGYVCHIQDVVTGAKRTISSPIYALAPDGRTAVTPDFRRIANLRPGYGYVGFPDPFAHERAPEQSGIWRVNLESGRSDLIISLAQAAAIRWPYADFGDAVHWFNHLLVNPTGTRFVFLHRWKLPDEKSWRTRMFSSNMDGSDLRVLIGSGFVSHFIWRDETHVLAYSKPEPDAAWGFYLYEDVPNGRVEQVGAGVMGPGDGHCNYLPGNEWIVCDTYPDKNRYQHVYLYHVPSNRRIELASLLSPAEYAGEWRCDTHPRVSRTGKFITVDSPHEGGREIYLIDVSKIIG